MTPNEDQSAPVPQPAQTPRDGSEDSPRLFALIAIGMTFFSMIAGLALMVWLVYWVLHWKIFV